MLRLAFSLIGLMFWFNTNAQFFTSTPKIQPGQNPKKVKPLKDDYIVTISTEFGEIELLLSDKTPLHKENFLKLTNEKFFDGTTFHRIIKGFMIQGGDPNSKDSIPDNDGNGGPGYTIPAEFDTTLTHVHGVIAAARLGDFQNPKKESSGSQFYIVENPNGTPFLNRNYTVFGKVIKGLEVVSVIAEQPKDGRDRPFKDIKMVVKAEKMKRKKIEKKYGIVYE